MRTGRSGFRRRIPRNAGDTRMRRPDGLRTGSGAIRLFFHMFHSDIQ